MFKNRLIAMMLVITMIVAGLSGCGNAANQNLGDESETSQEVSKEVQESEATKESASNIDVLTEELSLPKVGDVISGFTVKKITDYPKRNGVLIEMEYTKTGTPLIFLANADEDKAFTASYLTRVNNNKGIPHIFEHVTLSGSPKYPNASLFTAISDGTYNTFMNASTEIEATSYEFASLSDEQLISIARYYLSGLSDPWALKDSHPLGREAYRYQLYDKNDDISVTGAVYNEMEASNSNIQRVAFQGLLDCLYPGSYMDVNSGGVRDDIITVTLDELQEFYDTYYHPSNMIISLYGNVDYVSFLEFLDTEYLSKYDKQEVNISDINYKPWEGYKEAVFDLPTEEGTEVLNQAGTVYAMSLPDISDYDLALVCNIVDIMCKEGSSLSKRIENEYPSCKLEAFYDTHLDIPFVGFYLNNSNEGDEKTIRDIINEEFEKIVENGFDQDMIDAFANKKEAELLIKADDHGGTDELYEMCVYMACHGKSVDGYLKFIEGGQSVSKANEDGRLKELVDKYILKPETSIALCVVPRPGLYEEKWAEHEKILSDMKSGMSEEEIQKLIDNTLEFDEWSKKDSESVDISQFSEVEVEGLDVSFDKPEITKSKEGNVNVYSCDLGDVGYVTSGTLLSADCVPAEKLYDFKLAAALLGKLSTKNYDDSKLALNMNRDLYEYSLDTYLYHDWQTDEPHMALRYDFTVLSRNIEDAAMYFDEIINTTDFTDTERIKFLISSEYNSVKDSIDSSPISVVKVYDLALNDSNYKIDYFTRGFGYLAYLKELTQMSDEDIEKKMTDIQDVINIVKNQNGAIFYMSGDGEDLKKCQNDMFKVISGLSSENLTRTDFGSALPELEKADKIAIITNDSATYNGASSSAVVKVMPYSGVSAVVNRYVQNNIVYPAFRYDIGAYGGYTGYYGDKTSFYIYSYRDSQVVKSFDFIDSLADMIKNVEVTTDDIAAAKLRIFSDYAYPENKSGIAINEIYYDIKNHGSYVDFLNTTLKEIKSVTTQNVYDSVDAYKILVDEGIKFSYGSGSKIKEAGGYDLIFEDLVK